MSATPLPLPALALRYAAFATFATLANLGVQRLALALWPAPGALLVALITGTGIGLVVKYLLDKHWIFYDREGGARAHGRKFGLYTAMGLITTAIFWGMEAGAWALWHSTAAREAGAILGLAIGYVIKFQLDRRYVFRSNQ
ncbi:polysaccharide biosynthesis protein GtrA [Celeribacter ethanolicus]|uniref:Polysaccharide biosynthesis protein GtrA n=1 Tax=Celeribacter ethanolicus TaxID=1758178 RepID=A0A291GB81_9RHOB|nr:GtrA family protein [Celeribacter ethanolicus]ATG47659.1 polysaccharide biosynthesis protein GtrA [Celeribacter ethanolicus]